jgi:Short C-terminal domain
VEQKIAERHRPHHGAAQVSTPSIPEQISQLAALRDAGILTEEEFNAKKAELLSRL